MLKSFAMRFKTSVGCWVPCLFICASFVLPPAARADGAVKEAAGQTANLPVVNPPAKQMGWSIAVRAHDPTQPYAPYGDSAAVAAGAQDTDEHKADIKVTVSPPTPGLNVPPISIMAAPPAPGQPPADQNVGENGVEATVIFGNAKTNQKGEVYGVFRSSNIVRDIILRLPSGAPADSSKRELTSVTIYQVWNSMFGERWIAERYFSPRKPSKITYKMHFGHRPITKHSIWFKATAVTGEEWNPHLPVDINGDGVPDFIGDYVPMMTTPEVDPRFESEGIYHGLIRFSPTREGSNPKTGKGNGEYTTTQIVHDYISAHGTIDFYLDSLEVDVVDGGIYDNTTDNPTD